MLCMPNGLRRARLWQQVFVMDMIPLLLLGEFRVSDQPAIFRPRADSEMLSATNLIHALDLISLLSDYTEAAAARRH